MESNETTTNAVVDDYGEWVRGRKKKLYDNKIYDSKTIDREIGIKIYFLSTSGLNENMHLHSLQHRNIC